MGFLFSSCKAKEEVDDKRNIKTGQKKRQQASETDMTMMKLKMLQDKFYDQRKHLEHSLEKAEAEALNYAKTGKKNLAVFALQRKKLFAQYLEDSNTKYNFIQKQIATVEQKQMEAEMLVVLREADQLLQDMQQALNLDEMEEIVGNIKASEEKNKEFDRILRQHNISPQDKDIEAEYAKIEAEPVSYTHLTLPTIYSV
eukprot:TRINITY_DN5380_c0_g1_i1.p1 TRINITY_DN5380_c0_g1~~TRINITY_DN5380_c0_g1_i1.p1  ORF type:complete len:199 (-),score=63.73 TRINITY_DN5380_c0_g1_i1:35-631(-)